MTKEAGTTLPAPTEIILPPELETLPEVCQEGVRNILLRIKRMKEERPWSEVRSQEELKSQILPQALNSSQEFFSALKPWKKEGKDWRDAQYAAGDAAYHAAWVADRGPTWTAVWVAFRDGVRDIAGELGDVDGDLGGAAIRETIKDLTGFENNCHLPLLSLRELGAVEIGFRKVDEEEKFVVKFPLDIDGKRVVGYVAFGPDRSCDKEVRLESQRVIA